jgi:hypothetical protein
MMRTMGPSRKAKPISTARTMANRIALRRKLDPTKIGADGQVPEAMCKIGEVQAELAAVKGYHMFILATSNRLHDADHGTLQESKADLNCEDHGE